MIPEVNITEKQMLMEPGGFWGCFEPLSRDFRGQSPLRKLLGSKKHLDWLKIYLNAAKIITVQEYEGAKN